MVNGGEKSGGQSAGASRALWFVGDVHLGRRTASLPPSLSERGVDARALGPSAAWRSLVEAVVTDGAEAVVFAGDLVDSDAARFETRGLLEEGVHALLAAGVRVCAVVGNHDVEALPRLARVLDGFEILGEGGVWEERDDFEALSLLAWSFPAARVRTSPVASLPPALAVRPSNRPRVAVLHADLDAGVASPYAPVSSAELRALAVDACFLGHIHEPSLEPGIFAAGGAARLGYLGSLAPLHRGERGLRSAWRVSAADGGGLRSERVSVAPLRFDRVELDFAASAEADVQDAVAHACREHAAELDARGELSSLEALVLEVCVHGDATSDDLRRELAAIAEGGLTLRFGSVVVCVDRVTPQLRVPIDLLELARGSDARAVLARELIALEAQRADPALLDRFEASALRLGREARFREAAASSESSVDRMIRVGHRVLEAMLR